MCVPSGLQDQDTIEKALANLEGCNIFGHLDVKRVAGNFHISVQSNSFMNMKQTQREILEAIQRFQRAVEKGGQPHNRVLEVRHSCCGAIIPSREGADVPWNGWCAE